MYEKVGCEREDLAQRVLEILSAVCPGLSLYNMTLPPVTYSLLSSQNFKN